MKLGLTRSLLLASAFVLCASCDQSALPVRESTFACTSDISCGAGHRCVIGLCRSQTDCAVVENRCDDKRDDDCNGFVDCRDPACACFDAGASPDGGPEAGPDGGADAGVDGGESRDGGPVADGGQERFCNAQTPLLQNGDTVGVWGAGFPTLGLAGQGCAGSLGSPPTAQLFWLVKVPARQLINITVTPSDADIAVNLVESCQDVACLTGIDAAGPRGAETVSYFNDSATEQNVILTVSARGTASGSVFVRHRSGSPVQEACGPPEVVIASTTSVTTSWLGAMGDHRFTTRDETCVPYIGFADLVVPIAVPAFSRASITAESAPDIALNVLEAQSGCPPMATRCRAWADVRRSQFEGTAIENAAAEPRNFFLIVSLLGSVASSSPLRISVEMATRPIPGDLCATVPNLIQGTTSLPRQTMTGFQYDYDFTAGNNCAPTQRGADRMYDIELGAGQVAQVSLAQVSGFDPVLFGHRVQGSCEQPPNFCDIRSDMGLTGEPESTFIANYLDVPRRFRAYVAAKGRSQSNGVFDLQVSYNGDTCPTNTGNFVIRENTVLTSESFGGDRPNMTLGSVSCVSPAGGASRAYLLELDGGSLATARVTSSVPTVLNLIRAPSQCQSAGVCLAGC